MSEWVEVRIEIVRGSRNKYEWDDAAGVLRLDRVLYSSVHYPTDYGFIPDTLAEDGDHLDALVLVQEPTIPGCIVRARPVGLLVMEDEAGKDDKVLAVPVGDPRFAEVRGLEDLPRHWLTEIEHFFRTYKLLEAKEVHVLAWEGREAAWGAIARARAAYSPR